MKVVGFDPGRENFAWAVWDSDNQRVVDFGWIQGHPINEHDLRFINSILEVLDKHKPGMIGIERFAYRKEASVESEPINVMIGKLDLLCRMRGYRPIHIMPAHWKVRYKTKLLKSTREMFPEIPLKSWVVHQADAAGIAKYVVERKEIEEAKEEMKAEKAKKKKLKLK